MTTYPLPGILISPASSTLVSIVGSSGLVPTVYTDAFGVSAVGFPRTVATATTYYMLPGIYTVTGSNLNSTVALSYGQVAQVSPAFTYMTRNRYTFNVPSTVSAGTLGPYFVEPVAAQTANIVAVSYVCAVGSCTVAIQLNGTNVSGLGALSVTTVATATTVTAQVPVGSSAPGDQVTCVITSPSGCSGLAVTVFVEDTI